MNYRAGELIECKFCERRDWVYYRTKIIQMADICEAHSIVEPRLGVRYDICYCHYHGPDQKPYHIIWHEKVAREQILLPLDF